MNKEPFQSKKLVSQDLSYGETLLRVGNDLLSSKKVYVPPVINKCFVPDAIMLSPGTGDDHLTANGNS